MKARLPDNEVQRLDALRKLGLLDTVSEERFDRVTRLACQLFGVPIALVTLVDTNRQWFKSCVGLGVSETPRSQAFCAHAILQDDALVVADARLDVRFRDNPLVTGPPHIRFYAGQPLRSAGGYKLGTLCIIDTAPRAMTDAEVQSLRDLAVIIETEINARQSRALDVLREIAASVGVLDFTRLSQLVVDRALELTNASSAAVFIWDDDEQVLNLAAKDAEFPFSMHAVRAGEGSLGTAFATREMVVINDYPAWPHALDWILASGTRSVASIPLVVQDHAVGVLSLTSRTLDGFGAQEVEVIQLLAAQVSPSLEASQAVAEAERRRTVAEDLVELMHAAARKADSKAVTGVLAEKSNQMLGSDYVCVSLCQPDGTLRTEAVYGIGSEAWANPTVLSVPLVFGGVVTGALMAGWQSDRTISAVQRELVGSLASYGAQLIASARSRDALAASEDRYRDLFENATDLIQSIASDGRLLYVNQAWLTTLEYTADEITDLSIFDVIRPDYREKCTAMFGRVLAGEDVAGVDVAFVSRTGRSVFVEGKVNCRFVNGLPIATRAIFRDVTDRRAIERALVQEQHRYKALFDHSIDAILLTTVDGNILSANSAACQLFGATESELNVIGRERLVDSTDRRFKAALEERSRCGYFRSELTLRRMSRELFPADVSSGTFDDAQGRTISSLFIRDISERKLAEEQVRRQGVKLTEQAHELEAALARVELQVEVSERTSSEMQAVLDSASDAMVLVGTDSRFLSMNRAAERLFQTQADVVIGKYFHELLPVVERVFAEPDKFVALVAHSADDPDRRFSEVIVQRWPVPRELQLYSVPVATHTGINLGRLFVYRDVTKDREVDRMKSEFVALVSHELRTPLTSVKGYVDLLLDEEAGAISDPQRTFLGIVKASADRLVALINDLLDVSRIESGKIALSLGPTDIQRVVTDVAAMFTRQLAEKHQHITLDFSGGVANVLADEDRLIQILVNLVSNAHKYTPSGGSIKVTAGIHGSRLRVEVTDTGIGISPDDQLQLFSKFFRAQNRATQEVGGTGLGLSISRTLVEMQGGQMEVFSVPGQGSTFAFELPVSPDPEPERTTTEGTSLVGARILVVDDDPDILVLIGRYLGRVGCEVMDATTGDDAFQLALSERPDLITLDMHLPDTDGLTVLNRLRAEPVTASIPVIVLSVSKDEGDAARLGAAGYLEKPIDDQQLLTKIATVLRDAGRRHR